MWKTGGGILALRDLPGENSGAEKDLETETA